MKITLLCIGKTKEMFVADGMSFYEKRIKKYVRFEVKEIPIPQRFSMSKPDDIINKECDLLQSAIKRKDCFVLLDEKGHQFSSDKFAGYIQHLFNTESRDIVFIIGGAYGFSDDFKKNANTLISLSAMTFPHQLVRVIFLEQFYRALTILKNEPYHHS